MPKIRIIDPKTNFRLSMPVPYKLFIHGFVRRSIIVNGVRSHVRALEKELVDMVPEYPDYIEDQRTDIKQAQQFLAFVEALDYRALRMSLSDIDRYKGLVIVDIQSSDGTVVHITL